MVAQKTAWPVHVGRMPRPAGQDFDTPGTWLTNPSVHHWAAPLISEALAGGIQAQTKNLRRGQRTHSFEPPLPGLRSQQPAGWIAFL